MSATWPQVSLGAVMTHRKEFIQINDLDKYKRCRVKLHTQGIVLRDAVTGAEIKTKKQQVCKAGEFLVAEIDAKVGGFGIVPDDLNGSIVSSHYFLFGIDEEKLDMRFMDFYSRTPAFRDQVAAQGSTNYAAIRPNDVLGYSIPLPPLAEQRRIVARIEELVEKIEESRGLRQQSVEEVKTLCSAGSSLAFKGEWQVAFLENICSLVTDGTHQTPRYVDDGYTFLSAQNIKPFRFMPEIHRKVSYEDYVGCQKRAKPHKGDVLLTRVGAGIGEAAVLDREIDFAFYVSLALIRPIADKILPEFLVYWLNSPDGLNQSRGQTLGKGHSQGNLNLKLLRKFSLPLPPIPEQNRIVAFLDNLHSQVNVLKRLQTETAAELEAMLPSILAKAFQGAL